MKRILVIILIVCIIFLVGCNAVTTVHPVQEIDQGVVTLPPKTTDDAPSEQLVEEPLSFKSNLFLGSGNEFGYYSIIAYYSYYNIMYIDYETKEKSVLCNDTQCTHNSKDCIGYIDEKYGAPSILALEDKIVFIYPGNLYLNEQNTDKDTFLARIEVADLDGSNRKKILALSDGELINTNTVVYDECGFIYLLIETYGSIENATLLKVDFCQIDLSTGEVISVKEFDVSSSKKVFLLGSMDNQFVFKYIYDGEWDESLIGREQWDRYIDTQLHEIFTISRSGETSPNSFSYPQGVYTSFVEDNTVMLVHIEEKAIYYYNSIDNKVIQSGNILPIEGELLYIHPVILIDRWLVFDYIRDGNNRYDERCAINIDSGETKQINLTASIFDAYNHYIIYDTVGEKILVCISTHLEDIFTDDTKSSRQVIDWALINYSDYLMNTRNFEMIS